MPESPAEYVKRVMGPRALAGCLAERQILVSLTYSQWEMVMELVAKTGPNETPEQIDAYDVVARLIDEQIGEGE